MLWKNRAYAWVSHRFAVARPVTGLSVKKTVNMLPSWSQRTLSPTVAHLEEVPEEVLINNARALVSKHNWRTREVETGKQDFLHPYTIHVLYTFVTSPS